MKIVKVIYNEGGKTSVCTTDAMDEEAAERERARIEDALVSGTSNFARVGRHTLRVDAIVRVSIEDEEAGASHGDFGEPEFRRDMKF